MHNEAVMAQNRVNTIIHEENIDIYQHPTTINTHANHNQITIGDLHANAIKFIFILIKEGILKLEEQSDFQKLVNIYNKLPIAHNKTFALYRDGVVDGKHAMHAQCRKAYLDAKNDPILTKEDIATFKTILANSTIPEESRKKLIRLIGDETGDRGANDIFILLLLQKLNNEEIPYEILASNHGSEFIMAYEKYETDDHILDFQRASLLALQLLIQNGTIDQKTVDDLINTVYKPSLTLLSYTLSNNESEITLFSHAGIGLNTIQGLAKKFNVAYKDDTAKDLALTIERINEKFKVLVNTNQVHTFDKEPEEHPVRQVLWNRQYDHLERPATKKNYKISFVHGHDADDLTENNIINVDNVLGKQGRAEKYFNPPKNDYDILMTNGRKLSEQEKVNTFQEPHNIPTVSKTENTLFMAPPALPKKAVKIKEPAPKDNSWSSTISMFAAPVIITGMVFIAAMAANKKM